MLILTAFYYSPQLYNGRYVLLNVSDGHYCHNIRHIFDTLFVSADKTYAFYIHGAEEQICSGYLYKSPPENLFKSQVCFSKGAEQVLLSINGRLPLPISLMLYFLQKSWKRRFFVLLKYSNNIFQLKYYKNEEKNKPLGDIDLSKYVQ